MTTPVNDRFLRAARSEPVARTPVWLMRQAGRILPEYRAVREKHTFLELAREPELCAEVTRQPVDALDVDAAILFSDILLPLEALGVGLDFTPGPVLDSPFDEARGVESLRQPEPARDYAYLAACVEAVLARLENRVPLIGFAGAPFTLAIYLLDGGGSKSYPRTRRLLHTDPAGFTELLVFLADRIAEWLQVQIAAGVHAFQLFDSWAGILSPEAMARFALPAARRVLDRVTIPDDFPTIYFAPGAGTTLSLQAELPTTVLGLDWRVNLGEVRAALPGRALQGNLDPGALLGSPDTIEREVRRIIEGACKGAASGESGGHVFNLGHGVLPDTPWENARLLVRLVHEIGAA